MSAAAQSHLISSAGKIQLLDLAQLKERLGPKWDRMAEHVQLFFEAAIRRSLKPGDTFVRHGELGYLVMFRDLTAAEAEVKCASISDELCRRLFGANGEDVSLRNLIANVALTTIPSGPEQTASLNALLEREGKEVVIARSGPVAIASASKQLRLTMVGNPAVRLRVPPQDIGYVYRPIWDSINHVVLTYLCQPVIGAAAAQGAGGFCAAYEEEDQAALDLLVLKQGLEHGARLRAAGLRVILAVPVHFPTVARARTWREYSNALHQIEEEVRRDLASVVLGIERSVPHIRLVQELPKLSRMAYRVFCLADRCQKVGARFANTGTHGIGLELDEKEDEAQTAIRLRDLAREAQAATIEAFALGLRSTSLALGAIHAGMRYLEGPVVRPAVVDPRHGFAHDIEDLYKSKRMARAS